MVVEDVRRPSRRSYLTAWLALVASALLADLIARSYSAVHFGKDNGMVFRMALFVFSCSILYGYVERRGFTSALLGLAIGVGVQICAFAAYFLSSLLIKGDSSGWDIPLVWDQLIAAGFLLLFGIASRRRPLTTR